MKKTRFLFITLFFALIFCWGNVFAADIFLGINTAEVKIGSTVSAVVYVNSGNSSINSAEGIISFPQDLLSVESVSMGGSIFSIWVEQPSYSNSLGTVSFNGGSPNPGFLGSNGSVIRVTFKTKKVGLAQLSFNSASVYANDGLGTDVTAARMGASVNIVAQSEPVIQTTVSLPEAPFITSKEMPNQESWYSRDNAIFSWNVPSQVTSVQILLGSNPNGVPSVSYSPPIGNKELLSLSDGTQYLSVRFGNANGWGKTERRKIKIDTVSPTDLVVSYSADQNDHIQLSLSAKDKTSGIQSYKVSENGRMFFETVVEGSNENKTGVTIPSANPGFHELSVRVFDRAGNSLEKLITVEFPKIKPPEITSYTETITKGEKIKITGTTYPDQEIMLSVQSEDKKAKIYSVKSTSTGVFNFESDYIETTGLTSVWAEVVRGENVKSEPSNKVYVHVNKTLVVKTGLWAIEVLMVLIPLLILILILMYSTYYGFHKFRKLRKRLLVDLDKVEDDSHKVFKVIKDDVKKSLSLIKKNSSKKRITEEEKDILEILERDTEKAEQYFDDRLEKIEKDNLK